MCKLVISYALWLNFHLDTGALLSFFLEPIYISSITVGRPSFDSENLLMVNHLRRSLHERIVPLTNKLTGPFQVNEVIVCGFPHFGHVAWQRRWANGSHQTQFSFYLTATPLSSSCATWGISTFRDCSRNFNLRVGLCVDYYCFMSTIVLLSVTLSDVAFSFICRYSICWNKCGLHEVILGTTGRKQGTSAKGALYPSTESSLCK